MLLQLFPLSPGTHTHTHICTYTKHTGIGWDSKISRVLGPPPPTTGVHSQCACVLSNPVQHKHVNRGTCIQKTSHIILRNTHTSLHIHPHTTTAHTLSDSSFTHSHPVPHAGMPRGGAGDQLSRGNPGLDLLGWGLREVVHHSSASVQSGDFTAAGTSPT